MVDPLDWSQGWPDYVHTQATSLSCLSMVNIYGIFTASLDNFYFFYRGETISKDIVESQPDVILMSDVVYYQDVCAYGDNSSI